MESFDMQKEVYSDIVPAPRETGTTLEDAMTAPGPQERRDSCALRAQQHVLKMFGIDISEANLRKDAIAHGEYATKDHSGTLIPDVGNLLERKGIDVHRYQGATMAHLISELAQGHKIIVGIDANEVLASGIQKPIEWLKDRIVKNPNHAVVVVNVDAHTLDVDIVDPADGKLHRVPASTFVDAWHDSKCFMVATNKSPSEFGLAQSEDERVYKNNFSSDSRIKCWDIDDDGWGDIIGFDYDGDGKIDEYFVVNGHDGLPDVSKGGFKRMEDISGLRNPEQGFYIDLKEKDFPMVSFRLKTEGTNMSEDDVKLGGLGHVSGVSEDSMSHLGSLGQVRGGLASGDINESLGGSGRDYHMDEDTDLPFEKLRLKAEGTNMSENDVKLGGLGHVSGVSEDTLPQLGSLGQLRGGLGLGGNEVGLGSLGHLSGASGEAMPQLGSLGQLRGGLAINGNDESLGSLGHLAGVSGEASSLERDGDGKQAITQDINGEDKNDILSANSDNDTLIDNLEMDSTGDGIPD